MLNAEKSLNFSIRHSAFGIQAAFFSSLVAKLRLKPPSHGPGGSGEPSLLVARPLSGRA
jgi:hypothetical protein